MLGILYRACLHAAWVIAIAALVAVVPVGADATAEPETETDDAARQRQQDAFEAMRAVPDDVELMFAHVSASLAAEDYEAAITTLERILIYRPELSRVRLELGAAYFRLGAYSVSEFYFREALAAGDLSPEEEQQIARFLEQIDVRTAETAFAGSAMAEIVVSTNANLGTSSDFIETSAGAFATPANIREAEDTGLRVLLNLAHQYDLGQPDGDFWRTDAQAYAVQYFSEDQGNLNAFLVRTGPRISLTPLAFGPKLRPFVEAEFYRADDQSLFRGLGAGLEFSDTLTADWSIFAVGRVQQREFFDSRSEFNGLYTRTQAGAVHDLTPALEFRGSLLFDYVETYEDFNDYVQVGVLGEFDYRYDPGFDWADRDWRATGSLLLARRSFGDADPRVAPNKDRRDNLLRIGFRNTAFLWDGYFAQLDLDIIQRGSNVSNFEVDGITMALSAGKTF